MSQHPERREYYRIHDMLALEFQLLPKEQPITDSSIMPFTLDTHLQLLHALYELDHESSTTLRQIGDEDRQLGNYLRTLNRKIELIAMAMFATPNTETPSPTHDVTLSETGLSFRHTQPLEIDRHLALKLVFFPSYFGLLLFGRVVQCTALAQPLSDAEQNGEQTPALFTIGVEFVQIQEHERQLLARYILRKQAQQRREQLRHGEPNQAPHG